MKPSLCLNMIVKNEAERLARCLRSVLPYVKTAVICDTGSTDDTKDVIERVCKAHDVRYTIAEIDFVDFSQARNAAFAAAKLANGTAVPWCNFALLVDADMQLVVEDPAAFDDLMANALSYDMMQKAGGVSYANRRIVNLVDAHDNPYTGVTHEYLDLPAAGMIAGAHFIDHADGANRKDKYERDARLLEADLQRDPNNGRTLYYLANTYRDAAQPEEAVRVYDKRIALGGWDEETHSAMMHRAGCYRESGNEALFVQGMIGAFNFRPSRAEPLYDLAKYYREKGDNAAALLFAKAGASMPRPNDLLFVNDFVYSHGLRYEYSIAGYYDEKERARAFEVTDDLALDPSCPADLRWSARSNLYWHTKPLSHYCPSFTSTRLTFDPPAGYIAMNPSVEAVNDRIYCNIRCVNYTIDQHGCYIINTGGEAIDTRNFFCTLDSDMSVLHAREIMWHRPVPTFDLVTGLEDIRLWRYCGKLKFSATVREQHPSGVCQIMSGDLVFDHDDKFMLVQNSTMLSGIETHEKNWMPMPSRTYSGPRFMYRLDTIVEPGGPTEKFPVKVHVGDISGSSQLIRFKGGFIAVVHEAASGPDGKRTYWHRFAWFEDDGKLRRLSLPFVFLDRQIEFCAGIAYHPNHNDLILSFGVRDAEAYVATVAIEEVARMCWKFNEN